MNEPEFIETLGMGWKLHPVSGPTNRYIGDALSLGSGTVSFECNRYRNREIVAANLEPSFFGWEDVAGTLFSRGIRVVYDEGLLCLQARSEHGRFTMASSEHIKIKPYV